MPLVSSSSLIMILKFIFERLLTSAHVVRKQRHFMKADAARRVVAALSAYDPENSLEGRLEVLETQGHTLFLLNGAAVALCIDDAPFFTVRGAAALKPKRHLVTVDMGAVRFIRNGADVMSPGIVNADLAIEPGDQVAVVDERHKKPLGVGTALISGAEMIRAKRGKAIQIRHFVGDKIWQVSA
ncbi:MAG TPA: PUA domain-containing protein [Candidatus Bathyarchaeia archaeon]|nr:PUA domain-containing protein [Candidatus Bathyarchaeia archaeon]